MMDVLFSFRDWHDDALTSAAAAATAAAAAASSPTIIITHRGRLGFGATWMIQNRKQLRTLGVNSTVFSFVRESAIFTPKSVYYIIRNM
jgi:hypothetical protein